MKIYQGRVRLGVGHSLIVGHGPRLARLEALNKDDANRIASFGLFNIGTPDTKTYYKDVKEEDLNPKPEDYIRPIFRGLSEVIVRKNYDPIDFSKDGILKASTPLLLAQSIFTNHEAAVGNEVGVVSKVFWDQGYEVDGFKIPAGINFEALIDGKIHPKLARDIQSDPPTVHSNSVTVNFKWAQSHPQMSFDEFRSKVGTFDAKKQLIRRIATLIEAYHETSFVAHGADPYAQKTDQNGKIVNPRYAANRDSFSEGLAAYSEGKQTQYYFADFKTSLSEDNTSSEQNNIIENEDANSTQTQIGMKKEIILLMALLAGVSLTAEEQAIPDGEFQEKFDYAKFDAAVLANKTSLDELQTKVVDSEKLTTLETENQTLTKFKTDNESKLADINKVESFKAKQLAELMRVSTALTGKAPEGTLKATYESADLATLEAFITQMSTQLESKFPLECKKCHSKEVSRASASASFEEEDKSKDKNPKEAGASFRDSKIRKTNESFFN